MTEFMQLTGMPQVIPNTDTKDVRFVLSVSDGSALACRADFGTVAQIAGGLGAALRIVQATLDSEGAAVEFPVEKLEQAHIQKDQWSENVFLRLTTAQGIPFVFQIPCQKALDIAGLLRKEGSKETKVGSA